MAETADGKSHDAVVEKQFGPRAMAYVTSAVHAAGDDLDAIEAVAAAMKPMRALDLGTGGGHVAYRLAAHAREVVASDLSGEMLRAVSEMARSRGLTNLSVTQAAAEDLPFDDGGFDLLACRFSAHHWSDLDAGLRQAHRVTRPGGPAIFVDVVSPGRPLLDTHLQAIELLRDPSHVRDYSAAEWISALDRGGFAVRRVQEIKIRIEFAAWIQRMNTPDAQAVAVRILQEAASEEVRRYFAIEPDGSFQLQVMILEARS